VALIVSIDGDGLYVCVRISSGSYLVREEKEEGRRKKEEGRRKKEEGRRKKERCNGLSANHYVTKFDARKEI